MLKVATFYKILIYFQAVKVLFFLSGVEVLQVLGVEVPIGGSTESNVRSFEAFAMIYLSIIPSITLGETINSLYPVFNSCIIFSGVENRNQVPILLRSLLLNVGFFYDRYTMSVWQCRCRS
jgi:hypothetical protein